MDITKSKTQIRDKIREILHKNHFIIKLLHLKKFGLNYAGSCPFCIDRESFTYNPRRQTFHCFNCKKGGDVFAFYMEYKKISYNKALKQLDKEFVTICQTL